MSAQRYFRRPVLGATFARYYLLAGERTVEAVQISRPDGVEVPEPPGLRWALKAREHSPFRRPAINPPLAAAPRICTRCGRSFPRREFSHKGSRRAAWCRDCSNDHQRQRRAHAAD